MNVRLVNKTIGQPGTEYEGKTLDEIIVGIARISSSREANEMFAEPHKLLRHCLMNGHWSVFATVNLAFEITTSRAIGRELLRHWSLKPQELSQRYVPISQFEEIELRQQAKNNRQSSSEIFDPLIFDGFYDEEQTMKDSGDLASTVIAEHLKQTIKLYQELLDKGVARECARFILPESATTKIIFNGTVRDWITMLNLRLHKTAQKEAKLIAQEIKNIFLVELPIISQCLFNFDNAEEVHILDRLILEKYKVYDKI